MIETEAHAWIEDALARFCGREPRLMTHVAERAHALSGGAIPATECLLPHRIDVGTLDENLRGIEGLRQMSQRFGMTRSS